MVVNGWNHYGINAPICFLRPTLKPIKASTHVRKAICDQARQHIEVGFLLHCLNNTTRPVKGGWY